MGDTIARYRVCVNARHYVHATEFSAWYFPAMSEWRERLKECIEKDGRSLRSLSLAAKHGPNFVQQLLKNEKDPGFQKLADLLSVLGADATVYVTTGVRLGTPDQLRATLEANGLPKNELATVLEIIRRFTPGSAAISEQSQSDSQPQPANPPHEPAPSGKLVRPFSS